MSSETAQLIAKFEALPVDEKQSFLQELFLRLPPIDSGAVSDDTIAAGADQLAALIAEDEERARTR